MSKRGNKPPPFAPMPRVSVEGFRAMTVYDVENYTRGLVARPHCFNGIVGVYRYRITCEVIPEPVEVIHARIIDLWERSDNYHDMGPLQSAATALGLTLPETWSKRRKEPRP